MFWLLMQPSSGQLKLKERNHMENTDTDVRIILKYMLRE